MLAIYLCWCRENCLGTSTHIILLTSLNQKHLIILGKEQACSHKCFYRAEHSDAIYLLLKMKCSVILGASNLFTSCTDELDLFNRYHQADLCYNDRYCYNEQKYHLSSAFLFSEKRNLCSKIPLFPTP